MDKRRRKQPKTSSCCSEEVSSIEWDFINMSEQEEDLIYRMYRLVGDSASTLLDEMSPFELSRYIYAALLHLHVVLETVEAASFNDDLKAVRIYDTGGR
ncbi:hypothetical protein SLEP1_g2280 [Rubroshorea leprosula]|uniref:Uncharacterized protein n=1 Tax=Rubroshorea leprosula TaxID=152421 RepID=A0AAV5HSF6_9ROSI|nr:hypothetical protein SLEP1_g2280 [Rubroshorea leprosula]